MNIICTINEAKEIYDITVDKMSNTIKNHLLHETFPVVLSVDIDGILLNYCDLQNMKGGWPAF